MDKKLKSILGVVIYVRLSYLIKKRLGKHFYLCMIYQIGQFIIYKKILN